MENGRNHAAEDVFEMIFVFEIQYFLVHETNCCSFSLQTLIQIINVRQKINQKHQRYNKVVV